MPNMSYCRFENTSNDLKGCWEQFDEVDELSVGEAKARTRIIELACRIAESYGDEIGKDVQVGELEEASWVGRTSS